MKHLIVGVYLLHDWYQTVVATTYENISWIQCCYITFTLIQMLHAFCLVESLRGKVPI